MKKTLKIVGITLAIPAGLFVLVFLWALGMVITGHKPPNHGAAAGTSAKTEASSQPKTGTSPAQDGPARDDPSTYMMYSKDFIIGMGGDASYHTVLDHCEKDGGNISCKAHTLEEDLKAEGKFKRECRGFEGYKFYVKAYHYGNDPRNAIALPGAFASVPDVGCHENFVFDVHVPEGTDVVTLYYFN